MTSPGPGMDGEDFERGECTSGNTEASQRPRQSHDLFLQKIVIAPDRGSCVSRWRCESPYLTAHARRVTLRNELECCRPVETGIPDLGR